MKTKTSILQKVIQDIYNCTDYESAKKIFIDTVDKSRINSDNKIKMKANIRDIESKYSSEKARLDAIKIYATNSMFDKQGMSTRTKYRY